MMRQRFGIGVEGMLGREDKLKVAKDTAFLYMMMSLSEITKIGGKFAL